jgi:S1-C subfamily serine protease
MNEIVIHKITKQIILFLFSMVLITGLAGAQTEYSKEVKKLVVMLEAEAGEDYQLGAGVVFAVARNRIYVVTAKHVVQMNDADADSIKVKFWQLPGEEFEATLLAPLDSTLELDMAVLYVKVEDAGLTLDDFPFELLTGGDVETSGKVVSVGQGSGRAWVYLENDLNVLSKQAGVLEFQFLDVSRGDSGGGVFNERGELLGMTITDAPPALRAIDAETLLSVLEQNQYEISVSRPKLPEQPLEENSGQVAGGGPATVNNDDATNASTTNASANDVTTSNNDTSNTPLTATTETPTNEPAKLQIGGAQATTIFGDGYSALQAIDGSIETYWSTAPEQTSDAAITFLFNKPTTISGLNMFFTADPLGLMMETAVLSTPDGTTREITFRGLAGWESVSFEALTTDTLTLTPTSYFSVGSPVFVNVYELELYGY